MDLQPLFAAPIWEQSVLDPGYADHTNAVWRVRTAAGVAVVRVPRVPAAPANPFWWWSTCRGRCGPASRGRTRRCWQ